MAAKPTTAEAKGSSTNNLHAKSTQIPGSCQKAYQALLAGIAAE